MKTLGHGEALRNMRRVEIARGPRPTYSPESEVRCPVCSRATLRERHDVGTHRYCLGGHYFIQPAPGCPATIGTVEGFNRQAERPNGELHLSGRGRVDHV